MTETKKKALALLNEICVEMGLDKVRSLELDMPGERALLRAIEQHEAFKREVSDALSVYQKADGVEERSRIWDALTRFIIAKPDPLVEALNDLYPETSGNREYADKLRAAIEARGGRIVWEGE